MRDSANPTDFERSDVPPGLLLALAFGFVLTVAVVMASLAGAFPHALRDADKGPVGTLPPAPRLQAAPRRDLVAYETAERRRLATYGWSDLAQGRIHVPVEQAMREVAAQGWRSEGR